MRLLVRACVWHLLSTWRRRTPAFPRATCSLDSAKKTKHRKSQSRYRKKRGWGGGLSLFWTLWLQIRCSVCGLRRSSAWSRARDFSANTNKNTKTNITAAAGVSLGFSSGDKWTLLPTCIQQLCYWCWPSGSAQTAWRDQQVRDVWTPA